MKKLIIAILLILITSQTYADLYKITINSTDFKVPVYLETSRKTPIEIMTNSIIDIKGEKFFFIPAPTIIFIPMKNINFIRIEKAD